MKNGALMIGTALAAVIVSGCWTFNETPMPELPVVSACPENRDVSVGVNGFKATMTEYYAVLGYQAYYVPGHYGRHHYRPSYYATVPTTTYLPQIRPNEAFLMRARDSFEKAGFIVAAEKPDWSMEVEFVGPFAAPNDASNQALWLLGTVFFCDYAASEWHAKLRIRDNRTGKLVFHHDYTERYETNVFGLIPLISIASSEQTSSDYGKCRCLTLLTDRAVADASAEILRRAGVAK